MLGYKHLQHFTTNFITNLVLEFKKIKDFVNKRAKMLLPNLIFRIILMPGYPKTDPDPQHCCILYFNS